MFGDYEPVRENYARKPYYTGSIDDILVIQANEWAVTDASQKRPLIGTGGIVTCLAVVGYDPNAKEGFMVHFKGQSNVPFTLYDLQDELKGEYEMRIIGGTLHEQKLRADYIVRMFEEKLKGSFVEKDLLGKKVRSIVLDTRNGKLYRCRRMPVIVTQVIPHTGAVKVIGN
ncbi:hypothetical protein KY311_01890 [Candidatus Woesearchaeota archaeon]|nr:hypothetical protein [Candidatus Woesearchaeota archaeon]